MPKPPFAVSFAASVAVPVFALLLAVARPAPAHAQPVAGGRTKLSLAYGYFRETTPSESERGTSSTTFVDLKLTRAVYRGLQLGGTAGGQFGTVDSRYAGLSVGYQYMGFSTDVLWLPTAMRSERAADFTDGRGAGVDLGYSVKVGRRLSFGGQMNYRWFMYDAVEVAGVRREKSTSFRTRYPQLTLGYAF